MQITVISLFLFVAWSVNGENIPKPLQDGSADTPGIGLRITKKAVDYLSEVFGRIINNELSNFRLPTIEKDIGVVKGHFTLSNFHTTRVVKPDRYHVDLIPSDKAKLWFKGLDVDVETQFSAWAEIFGRLDAAGTMVGQGKNLQLDVTVQIDKTPEGTPNFTATDCSARLDSIKIQVPQASGSGAGLLRDHVGMFEGKAKDILEQKLCQGIKKFFSEALNTKFRRLGTKLAIRGPKNDKRKKSKNEENENEDEEQGKEHNEEEETSTEAKKSEGLSVEREAHPSEKHVEDVTAEDVNPEALDNAKDAGENNHRRHRRELRKKRTAADNYFEVEPAPTGEEDLELERPQSGEMMIDLRLTKKPVITDQYIETNHRGEISLMGEGETPFYPVGRGGITSTGTSKMLYVHALDYVINSLLYAQTRRDDGKLVINEETEPEIGPLLRTTCGGEPNNAGGGGGDPGLEVNNGGGQGERRRRHLNRRRRSSDEGSAEETIVPNGVCFGDLFPATKQTHPNHKVEMVFKPKTMPYVIADSEKATMFIQGTLDVFGVAEDESKELWLKSDVRATTEGNFQIKDNKLYGKLKLNEVNFSVKDSKLGVPPEQVESIGQSLVEILLERLNSALNKGIPLPNFLYAKLINSEVSLDDRSIDFDTDVEIDEAKLQAKAHEALMNEIQKQIANIGI